MATRAGRSPGPARSADSALSPAEAYEQARTRAAHPQLGRFVAGLEFELDDFQRRSCEALEQGHGVLVCAPTGAGKTVVGEFAVHLALTQGLKCFYTTPIKALSNQKYSDLVERHGADAVGLLTGDTAINGSAPVVVMTTEVLRNMLYAESSALDGLAYVVMDEVHYLADRFRGAVWEEVILHLPDHVQLASLSATVSNAEEFGDWLVEVRGDTTVVVDEQRPVPLWQHMVVGNRMFDLFAQETRDGGGEARLKVDPTLVRAVAEVDRSSEHRRSRSGPPGRGTRRGAGRSGPPAGIRPPGVRPPSRVDVVERLDAAGLLPAITFIFSRAGCNAAVTQCVRSGLRLNSTENVAAIREIVERRTAGLPDGDLEVLGYWEWRDGLERGVAAHHAGLLPAFKETVEELFVRGLVRAVFATETLALGINMPARTVVLEKLVKYNGEAHVELTPGEYTQLTGRAGRRGIDVEGHAVVLWAPGVDPGQVAGLASTRTYPLRSSFRPGYNMTVNLVDRLGSEQARELLEQSFAQFQADRSVVGLAKRIDRNREALAGYADAMGGANDRRGGDGGEVCDAASFAEYMDLRARVGAREKQLARQGRHEQKAQAVSSLESLRTGDVIAVTGGKRAGLAVVLDPGVDRSGRGQEPRPLVLTEDRWAGRLALTDFPDPVAALGTMKLPKHVDHRIPRIRRDLANALRDTGIRPPAREGSARRRKGAANEDQELASLRRAMRAHPAHGLADREDRARWAERHHRLERETEQLQQRVRTTTHSLVRTFDRIRSLLSERGYLDPADPDGITADGRRLSRLWGESDLLVAECLRRGVWTGLGPAELAAVASTLVYDSRRDDGGAPRVPDDAASAIEATVTLWTDLVADERRHHLDRTREPDLGFAWPVHRWVRGDALAAVLSSAQKYGVELSAGDFVRWCRQVVDLLDQIRSVASGSDDAASVARAAADAVRAIRRGVVAAGEG